MIRRLLALALLVPSLAWADYISTVNADSPIDFWYYDEPSGTTATDHGSSPHNQTYQNSPTLGVTGQISGHTAVTFNGSTQYVIANSVTPAVAPNAHDLSIECWVNVASIKNEFLFADQDISGGSCGSNLSYVFELQITGSDGKFRWQVYQGGGSGCSFYASVKSTTVASTGTWYQSVGTWNHTTPKVIVYTNGTNEANSTATTGTVSTITGGQLTTGAELNWSAGVIAQNIVNGTMQMCSLYNTQLSDARVLAHYTAGITAPATRAGWPFEGVKRDPTPLFLWPEKPLLAVNAPGFFIERINRKYVRNPGQYARP